jgi:hypothetical protein
MGLILSLGWIILWYFTILGSIAKYEKSTGALVVSILFCLFSFYWNIQVIKNSVHVIVSGVFAVYYFMGVDQGNGRIVVNAKNPTGSSAKRALTTSFGSICFGSLVIALIQFIRAIVRMAMDSAANEGNAVAAICLCCLQCIIGYLEWLIEYFNGMLFFSLSNF